MDGRGLTNRKMKKYLTLPTFWFLLTLVLSVIFIGASFYKIKSPVEFAHQIYNYHLSPPWLINPVANILPWFQLFCGLGLLWKPLAKGASCGIVGMMLIFQLALASALFRGLNISCGCFNAGATPATILTFGRDFLFLVLAVLVAWKIGRTEVHEN